MKDGIARRSWRAQVLMILAAAAASVGFLLGCAAPRSTSEDPDLPRSAVAEPGEDNERVSIPKKAPTEEKLLSLEPMECPPDAGCLPGFKLNGVLYTTTVNCDQVAEGSVGTPVDTAATASRHLPRSISRVEGFPVSSGVVVDWKCNERALALPVDEPEGADDALARAQLRCNALAEPSARDRCDQGGSARWRVGDAWYDYAFAPFPEAMSAADATISDDEVEGLWRTDPLEVASRTFEGEGVCTDKGEPCPLDFDVAVDPGDERAVFEGTVAPFPHVIWDITITVERLGEHSWWTTAMTIEPRDAPS